MLNKYYQIRGWIRSWKNTILNSSSNSNVYWHTIYNYPFKFFLILCPVLRIRIHLISNILGDWIRNRKNMRISMGQIYFLDKSFSPPPPTYWKIIFSQLLQMIFFSFYFAEIRQKVLKLTSKNSLSLKNLILKIKLSPTSWLYCELYWWFIV